jgi:hypothetical protein
VRAQPSLLGSDQPQTTLLTLICYWNMLALSTNFNAPEVFHMTFGQTLAKYVTSGWDHFCMGKQALTRFFSEGLRPPEMAKSRVHMLSCGQHFFDFISLWEDHPT